MDRPIPRPGEKYIHFKKKPYQIICVASHSETREKYVVYQALYGEFEFYVRPLEMFMSQVDREKYPNAEQKYRFELADEIKLNAPADLNMQRLDLNPNELDVLDLNQATFEDPAEEGANPILLQFLDTETLEEKYQLLKSLRETITERLIDDFAVVLDIVIPEGTLEERYMQLMNSVKTMQKYENTRLR